MKTDEKIAWVVLLLCIVAKVAPQVTTVGPSKATAAVYVYEKDDGSPPAYVLTALDKLNRQGIKATTFDDDTTDGDGDTPDQYKVPLAAAQAAGLPSLVVMAGDKAMTVVKNPAKEDDVLSVVK